MKYNSPQPENEVAIIGISIRLPQADTLNEFRTNLSEGRDSVREFSTDRRKRTSLPLEDNYHITGYIDDIDTFDHSFFNLSKGEAKTMAPQHRLLLQTAYNAFENAGYDPSILHGTRASVYLGDTKINYDELAIKADPSLVMGSHVSAMAGRISRFFDLRGPAAMIDTACSSSLVALRFAMNDLLSGESDLALVGTSSLNILPEKLRGGIDIGIQSPDGKSRSFSEDAAGTGSGEAVVALILKRHDLARRDGDRIHALVKSVALNHVGHRPSSLTAPDASSQAEVMVRAWEEADIDPLTISYIEAHGTGTRLGDPIEIEGINSAFSPLTKKIHFCNISTVKSNIGHTWNASGLVGIVKACLSLKHHELYPSLHSANLSPLIDFKKSVVNVTQELTHWNPECGIRRAGVSSYGVMGTNAHAILEEAPCLDESLEISDSDPKNFWFPISARSLDSLKASVDALRNYIKTQPDLSLANTQSTLVQGRGHFEYRYCVSASNVAALELELKDPSKNTKHDKEPIIALVISGESYASTELIQTIRQEHSDFNQLYCDCENAIAGNVGKEVAQFAFQYAFHGWLKGLGFKFKHLIGEGRGKHVVAAIQGKATLEESIKQCNEIKANTTPLRTRVSKLVTSFKESQLIFIEAGPKSIITELLKEIIPSSEKGGKSYVALAMGSEFDTFPKFLSELYCAGVMWNFSTCAGKGRTIDLPGYQFQKNRCWFDKVRTFDDASAAIDEAQQSNQAMNTLEEVTRIWKENLDTDDFDSETDFFDLGGDSIFALQIINKINKQFDTDLDSFIIFEHSTISELTKIIDEQSKQTKSTLEEVTRIWKENLETDDLDSEMDFFDLGGDSIFALQIINKINKQFDTDLDSFIIFEHSTISDLTKIIDEQVLLNGDKNSIDNNQPEDSSGSELFAVSPSQQQIWVGSQFENGSIAFNLTRSYKLNGHLDSSRLQDAINSIFIRHDSLRTTFQMIDGELLQRITPLSELSTKLEMIQLDQSKSLTEMQEATKQFAARPFDLENGPLLRVQLLQSDNDFQILTLCTHHIVVDGWSLDLLVRDLGAFIANNKNAKLPIITQTYEQQSKKLIAAHYGKNHVNYWLNKFTEIPAPIALPVHPKSGSLAFQGDYLECQLPKQVGEELIKFTQEHSGTKFVTLLTLFSAYLSRYTDDGQMVLGTSLVERGDKDTEQLVSMLVRTLPIKISVPQTTTMSKLYRDVWTTFNESLQNRSYSYEELIPELQRKGSLQSPHLFSVLIEYEQFGEVGDAAGSFLVDSNINATLLDTHLDTSVFPLNIMLSEQPDGFFYAVFRYDTGLFEKEHIEKMWKGFVEYTSILLNKPDNSFDSLPLLTEVEMQRIRTLGHRALDFDSNHLVHQVIEQHAVNSPDQLCMSTIDGDLTFAELNDRANQLARVFSDQHNVRPGSLVALVMDRSLLLVESILAVWKCGGAYMPVDPCHPHNFMASILDSAQTTAIMYDLHQVAESKVEKLAKCGHHFSPLTSNSANKEDTSNLNIKTAVTDLAYVIFTSGSTGVPKGAMVEHLGMLNHLYAKVVDLDLNESSIVIHNAPSSFDISVWQMFVAPLIGGQTIIIPQVTQLDPLKFTKEIQTSAASILEIVPSYLNTLFDAWEQSGLKPEFPALKYLLVTGEVILPHLANFWLDYFPNVPMVNAYGPTEASDDITHHIITEPILSGSVPVGRPIPNVFIYILDVERRVLPEGAVGDIYVSGICVGKGYLNDPEQTEKVFGTDPFDSNRRIYKTGDRGRWNSNGEIMFLGRMDNQVKVRGYRLDLGELERQLSTYPGIKDGAIISTPSAKDQLSAYIVLTGEGSIDSCRNHMAKILPHYMIPSTFIELDQLPLTNNGKVDRNALCKVSSPTPKAPVTIHEATSDDSITQTLMEIWSEVLGRSDFSTEDKFFDLGGNSLRAIQVSSRISNRLKVNIPLETLFAQPTISGLVNEVISSRPIEFETIPLIKKSDYYSIAPIQELLLEIEKDYDQRSAFNRNDLIHLHGKVEPDLFAKAFSNLVTQHESLRTTFRFEHGNAVQVISEMSTLTLPFQLLDFSEEKDPEESAKKFVESKIREPFEIFSEPLVRGDLLKITNEKYLLLLAMHQLISDGQSAQVLQENLLANYTGLIQGDPIPPTPEIQAKDVAAWRQNHLSLEQKNRLRNFWVSRLEGATTIIPLDTDQERPKVASFNGRRLRLELPNTLTENISTLAREADVTEFVVAQVAVSMLLMSCTDQTDITIGTYTLGRERLELEDQIGININTVPLRLKLRPEEELKAVLQKAQKDLLQAFENQSYPYGWTMKELGWSRGVDRSPLFDVMIAFDELDDELDDESHLPLWFEYLDIPRRSKEADLLFAFQRTGTQLAIVTTYNTDIFSESLAQEYAERLLKTLTLIVDGGSVSGVFTRGKK